MIDGLAQLEDGAARELTLHDILENVVVKIADEVDVEVSTHAWKIMYEQALPGARETMIAGVRVSYLGLDSLIASKETYREQDAVDRLKLLALRQNNRSDK